jgi:hypothetical protein
MTLEEPKKQIADDESEMMEGHQWCLTRWTKILISGDAMGLVKTRRLAAMRQKEKAKMGREKCESNQYPVFNTNLKCKQERSSK